MVHSGCTEVAVHGDLIPLDLLADFPVHLGRWPSLLVPRISAVSPPSCAEVRHVTDAIT